MASTETWSDLGSTQTYLSTELNALANDGRKIGAEIDNATAKAMFLAAELYVAEQGSARSAGAYVTLYLVPSVDGTNYTYGGDTLTPPATCLVGDFVLDAAVTARYVGLPCVAIPPTKFKLLVINKTGQAFAASGNTLKYRTYNREIS